jgi:uncharacterized cupredoxin-like copper-binding protein
MSRLSGRTVLIAAGATAALTVASLTAVAAAQPTSTRHWAGVGMMGSGRTSSCSVPSSLPGQRVTAMLGDMSGMMNGTTGGMMGGYSGGVMRGGAMMSGATGWMMLHAVPQHVAAGTVTIVAYNHGSRTHELVVLPLTSSDAIGARTIGTDNAVDETGSLGEASKSCGTGSGDGITAGSASWVTLNLKPGRYELGCNLPGHYAAGMYTELDVT